MGHASAAPTIERIEAVFPVDQGQPSLMLRLPNTKCIGGDGEVAALCGEYREPLFWSMFLLLNRLNAAWDEIQREGAAVLFRGELPAGDEGLFFPITILDNPRHDASYVTQENFGPLRSIIRYRTVEEAIQKANDTPYGLGASVWGRDPVMLDAVARRPEAGTVWINQNLNPHPDVPFTGHKASGLGVELSPEGLRDFCNPQIVAARQ
jgi:acyl-CoA reductase-like NAD-dependent aldehyde dehydrogenase